MTGALLKTGGVSRSVAAHRQGPLVSAASRRASTGPVARTSLKNKWGRSLTCRARGLGWWGRRFRLPAATGRSELWGRRNRLPHHDSAFMPARALPRLALRARDSPGTFPATSRLHSRAPWRGHSCLPRLALRARDSSRRFSLSRNCRLWSSPPGPPVLAQPPSSAYSSHHARSAGPAMIILGIGGILGDAASAILKDGELVAAVEESKLVRRRTHWGGHGDMPEHSIATCLELAGVQAGAGGRRRHGPPDPRIRPSTSSCAPSSPTAASSSSSTTSPTPPRPTTRRRSTRPPC